MVNKRKLSRSMSIPDYLLSHPKKREYRIQIAGYGTYYGSFTSEANAIRSAKKTAREAVRNTGGLPPVAVVTLAGQWHTTKGA